MPIRRANTATPHRFRAGNRTQHQHGTACRELTPVAPCKSAFRQAMAGTTALTAAAISGCLLLSDVAWGLPTDGTVVEGQAEIIYDTDSVTIQQGSDRVIIEWQTFDVAANESVTFIQPHELAAALNRVLSGDTTQILGSLSANGQVFISNPAGVVFGPDANVDVASIVATSLDIMNDRFMAGGRLEFDIAGDPTAVIENRGTINANGLAALVGPAARNSGAIVADVAILGGGEGFALDYYGDGLVNFAITDPTTQLPIDSDGNAVGALAENTGTILADGGQVILTADVAAGVIDNVINLDGVIQARTIGTSEGQVVLLGGDEGTVQVAGTIDAAGDDAGEAGGTVHVLGGQIALDLGAEIDVSGQAGGGTALIGGDRSGGDHVPTGALAYLEPAAGGGSGTAIVDVDAYQTDGFVPLSDVTYFDEGASVDAGSPAGEGGTVIVWGTEEVTFHGTIDTMGGAGGFIEVSTHGTGIIDGSAATGHFLLDPGDVCVTTSGTSGCAAGATEVADTLIEDVLDGGGVFELNTDVYGTSGTGRVDFGGNGNVIINNNTGTMGTFVIHAADEINTNEVGFQSNGTTGTNFEWYAGSSSTASPVATADIVLDGQVLNTGGGYVLFDAADDVSIGDPVRTSGGDVDLIARGGDGASTVIFRSDDAQIVSDGGTVTVQTDTLQINTSATSDPLIDASTGMVVLQPITDGRTIDLGTDDANSLSLTDDDIDRIAASILRIGSESSGSITISAAISPAQVTTLSLITGGDVVDAHDSTDADITVTNLAISSSGNVGGSSFNTSVTNLAFQNSSNTATGSPGFFQLANAGALTITEVDGLVSSSNDSFTAVLTQISATGALTIAVDTSIGGFAVFDAPTIAVQDTDSDPDTGPTVSAGTGLVFDADTVNLFGDLTTTSGTINGTATTVNVDNETSTGTTGNGAEIQDGLGVAATGATVIVAAGSYAESLVIEKSLDLFGANEGVSPNTGTRGAESVIEGSVQIAADVTEVEIDGFTIQDGATVLGETAGIHLGNNVDAITIENTIFTRTGTLDFDASRGILTSTSGVSDVEITDNQFSGWHTGVFVNPNADDVTIADNVFDGNMVGVSNDGPSGIGGVTITGNTFRNSAFEALGLGAAATRTITDNIFEDNLVHIAAYGTTGIPSLSDLVTVHGNTFDQYVITDLDDTGGRDALSSIYGAIQPAIDDSAAGATVTVSDGTFDGGVVIDKALTLLGDGFSATSTVTVADGTAGMTVTSGGVTIDGFLFNGDGDPVDAIGVLVDGSGAALSDILIGDADADGLGSGFAGLTTGLLVSDGATGNGVAVEIGLGNVFEDNVDGMVFDGAGIEIVGDTLNNTVFGTHTGNYIELVNGAEFEPGQPTVIDATGVSFDGTLGSAMTPEQLTALEDKLVHYPDDNTLGVLNTNDLFVVDGESIQFAVNAAGALGSAQTVTVLGGTFGGSVEVWVDDLTLTGQGATTIIDTDAVDTYANNGDADNGFQVAAISALSGGGDVSGVTIDGFAFDTVTTTGSNIGVELGEDGTAVSTAIGATVQNSAFIDLADGTVANAVGGTTTIGTVTMTDIATRGIHFLAALDSGDVIVIEDSAITAGNSAVLFGSSLTGTSVTIAGNTLTATGADGIRFGGALTDATVLVGGADDADANTIIGGVDNSVDNGIYFTDDISGGRVLVVGNTRVSGFFGVYFLSTIEDATVVFAGNGGDAADEGIFGLGSFGDAVVFDDTLTDADVTIGAATVTVAGETMTFGGNSRIVGQSEGIDVASISGGRFQVIGNTLIQGESGGAGIEFENDISDSAVIEVLGNTTISGADHGIEFDDFDNLSFTAPVTSSTVTIAGNGIVGVGSTEGGDGIWFGSALTDATVLIGAADVDLDGDGTTETSYGGNTITAARNGINVEGEVTTDTGTTTFTITDNTIGSSASRVGADGIAFAGGITGTATVTIGGADQTVYATDRAIDVVALTSPTTLSITGGTYDATGGALLVDNTGVSGTDGGLNLGDAAFVGGTDSTVLEVVTTDGFAGVNVDFSGSATFDGGTTGMHLSGPGIDIVDDTLGSIAFLSEFDTYIELANGAEFEPGQPTNIDATGVSFNGVLGSAMTLDQMLALEDRLVHYADDNTLGLINTNFRYVIDGESIQLAVNAAGAGLLGTDLSIEVLDGTFGGSVEVWVDDLTLIGQGDTTIIDTDAVDAYANNGDVDNGFQVAAISDLSGGGDVSGVTIDGFAFDTLATTGSNIGIELGEIGTSNAVDATVQNSSFNDLASGIVAKAVDGTTTISSVTMTEIALRGIRFRTALDSNDVILIEDSDITAASRAVLFSSTLTGTSVTIAGNTLTATGGAGIRFNGALTDAAVLIGGAEDADANTITANGTGIRVASAITNTTTGTTTFDVIGNTIGDETGTIIGNHGIRFSAITNTAGNDPDALAITIAGNEIGGIGLLSDDGIRFGSDVTDATVLIGGATDADANSIIADDNGLYFESISGGTVTVALNEQIRGEGFPGTGILAENVTDDAVFAVVGNTEIRGGDEGGVNGLDGIAIESAESSTIVIAGNEGIYGDYWDGIYMASLADTDVTIGPATVTVAGTSIDFDGNGTILGVENGLNIGTVSGGTFSVAENDLIQGTLESGIVVDYLESSALFEVVGNTLIRSGDGNGVTGDNGIAILGVNASTVVIADNDDIIGDSDNPDASTGAGIHFEYDLTDIDVTISGNGNIVGTNLGIGVGVGVADSTEISGGTFTVVDNDLIQGIEYAGIGVFRLSDEAMLAVVGNSVIRTGDDAGIDGFDGIDIFGAEDSTIVIAGNEQILGTGLDAIYIEDVLGGDLTNTDIIIGPATVTIDGTPTEFGGNGEIVGAEDGINIGAISGGSVTVADNTTIEGTTGSGIEFDGPVSDGAVLTVSGNTEITAGEEGIEFDAAVTGSTVEITENTDILGGTHGIAFLEAITDSIVSIDRNGTATQDGADYDGTAVVELDGFEIVGRISGAAGSGITFADILGESEVTVSRTMITGSGTNGLTFPGIASTGTTGVYNNFIRANDGDGVRFEGDIGGPVEVFQNYIVENGGDGIEVADTAAIDGGSLAVQVNFLPGTPFAFGNGGFGFNHAGTGSPDLEGNWWGTPGTGFVASIDGVGAGDLPTLITIATGDEDANVSPPFGNTDFEMFAFQPAVISEPLTTLLPELFPTDVETLLDEVRSAQSQLDRPGGASFFSNELGAPFQTNVFADNFSIGEVGGPGGLQPAAGGERQGPINLGDLEPAAGPGSQQAQAEDTCVETYFADFWNVDTACQ